MVILLHDFQMSAAAQRGLLRRAVNEASPSTKPPNQYCSQKERLGLGFLAASFVDIVGRIIFDFMIPFIISLQFLPLGC